MHALLVMIQGWIGSFGFVGVFLASVAEEVISPIPSALVQGVSGVVLFSGIPVTGHSLFLFFLTVPVPAALGVTLGSLPYVWLARKYGLAMIDRWGKWIGVSIDDLHKLEKKLAATAWDDIAYVGMRAFPVIPSVALAIYGGIIEMSWWRYSILSFIGVFIRATGLGLLGWLFGNTLDSVSSNVSRLENFGMIVCILLACSWFVWNKTKKDNQ